MKKITLTILMSMMVWATATAQEKPVLERQGKDLVKATYYYEGSEQIKQTGYFKEGKPHGKWLGFTPQGEIQQDGLYREGVKEGTWLMWSFDRELLYVIEYNQGQLEQKSQWALEQRDLVAGSK